MTIRTYGRMAMGKEFRAVLDSAFGLPVAISLTKFERDLDGVLMFDVEVAEANAPTDGVPRRCEGPGCLEMFVPKTGHARYHDDNCRLRAFRAVKRAGRKIEADAAAEALIAAAAETTP